jgi:malate/lactate dehydrogenase
MVSTVSPCLHYTEFFPESLYRIVKTVAENVLKHSPEAIIVVVSNPMDTMTYLALKATGLPKNKVIGMGGALDKLSFWAVRGTR